ncbi:MAG: hypothetical protein Q9217_006750, partial [Psora testacea]
MAYNSGYNPDALPAWVTRHAEPEQVSRSTKIHNWTAADLLKAAQILSSKQQQQQPQQPPKYSSPPRSLRPYSNSNPQAYSNAPQPPYQKKPQPPLPFQSQPYQAPPLRRNSPHISSNNASYGFNPSSPPPQNHGFGPPPHGNHVGLSPQSRPPGTPAPSSSNDSVDPSLFPLFKAVDRNGTGQLSERELRNALVNGDFTQFDPHTVKMMIRMFDVDKSGHINFDEFCRLWGFLASWRALFDRFDADKSGYISFDEYTNALVAFGYRLSSSFVTLLYTTYDKGGAGRMSFDLFVQSCIVLKRMTDVFKKYDEDRDGYITLSFEEFLT